MIQRWVKIKGRWVKVENIRVLEEFSPDELWAFLKLYETFPTIQSEEPPKDE